MLRCNTLGRRFSSIRKLTLGCGVTQRLKDGGRGKVIEAARACFLEKGFHQTAMAELAERSEVSIGQIYRLFENKSEMISAIIQEDTDARIARLSAIRDEVAAGRLTPLAGFERAALEVLEEGEQGLTFEIFAEGFHNSKVGDVIGILCERYRAMLREIVTVARSDLASSRLAALEEMLLAILFGFSSRALSRPPLSRTDTARDAAEMVMMMIRG